MLMMSWFDLRSQMIILGKSLDSYKFLVMVSLHLTRIASAWWEALMQDVQALEGV